MKNYKLNQDAKELDVRIETNIQYLETLGWDFDSYYENTANAMLSGAMPLYIATLQDIEDVSEREAKAMEMAKEYCYNNYIAVVKIEGTPEEPKTLYGWHNVMKNEDTQWEATGDDQQTIKDIICLLEDNTTSIDEKNDYSVDENETYVPSFIIA